MSEWDGETTPHASEGPQWVSAAEAADAAGVTPGTVRYWARNGLIVSEVVQGPAGERTLVRLDEVIQHARHDGGSGSHGGGSAHSPGPVTDLPARTSELAPILKSIPEIMAQLTAATDRAARAETKVEFLSAQLGDLRRRLADAEARPPAAADPVVPPAWEAPASDAVATDDPSTPAESPRAFGWPAPPADVTNAGTDYGAATSDAPATTTSGWGGETGPEPGPESIDWGAGTTDDVPREPDVAAAGTATAEPPAADPSPAPTSASTTDFSLEDLWAQPAKEDPWTTAGTREATPAAPAAPPPPASDADEVRWHEPAASASEAEPEPEPPPPPAPKANATVPDEEFYGPRRRRWFKRRT